jgi:hypothetical protein
VVGKVSNTMEIDFGRDTGYGFNITDESGRPLASFDGATRYDRHDYHDNGKRNAYETTVRPRNKSVDRHTTSSGSKQGRDDITSFPDHDLPGPIRPLVLASLQMVRLKRDIVTPPLHGHDPHGRVT